MSDDRLRAVEQGQAELKVLLTQSIAHQRDTNDRLLTLCSRHATFIDGNGKDGAKVRLDRLEQSSHRGRWWMRIVALPVIGLLVTKVWAAFGG